MIRRVLAAFVLLVLAASGYVAWRAHQFLTVPPETPGRELTVTIEPGSGFEQIAGQLYKQGVVTDPLAFKLLARYTGQDSKLKAGEYLLSTGLTPQKVLDLLASGQAVLYKLSVPEGLTMVQIARLAEQAGLGTAASFDKAARDKELLARYGVPADTAEGYLFPETYRFTRKPGNDARQVVEAMLAQFRKAAAKVWPQDPPQGKALHEAVILASIVEKETGQGSERARIAGVFTNRLNRKMLLQTDPTIIYGLGEKFDGNLKRVHLDDPRNPYNTYQHPGLPPGPICNPGLEALKAAASPETTDFLYFVAKNDGSHQFSKTLDEHNAAVARYQLRKGK
ncbi:Endolytic murein transglycosylase [Fundidesulfovibrio magnetotacticus]|uniref:Endolytic murein transglycosylase n=1 Tax=Fundidesulfovibrio magnetotacticus TaxID=2730080 RepID=A0A6V8LMY2_9BACT|nr:endolytic transglycosylase MltG [Fundidesulfovibrio magnetotacticus]GFK94032.1 Endolytic murein transglycosylase [Fundidesulfovibrio magnetotacticus]